MKKTKKIFALIIAVSMLLDSMPVYAAEDTQTPEEMEQTVPFLENSQEEDGHSDSQEEKGHSDSQEEEEHSDSQTEEQLFGNMENQESETAVPDTQEQLQPEEGAEEDAGDTEALVSAQALETEEGNDVFRWNILDDAWVDNYSPNGADKIVQATGNNKGKLLVGGTKLLFFRLDLSEAVSDRAIESAKIYLYKTDWNSNTIELDRAVTPTEKSWAAGDITAENMPDWNGEPAYSQTISGTNKMVEIDVTELAVQAVQDGEKTLDLKMNTVKEAMYPSEFISSRSDVEEQKPYFEVKYKTELSDEQKVALVIEEIKKLDGIYLSAKVPFPFFTQHENGAAVTWKSSNPEVVPVEGNVVQLEDSNVQAELTATVKSGSLEESVSIHVTVLKQQQLSPYAKESLTKLIEYTEESMKGQKESDEGQGSAGDYARAKGEVLRTLLEEAKQALNARQQENSYSSYCSRIIAAGSEYFGSGTISDKVIKTSEDNNGNGNLLEYSVYRAKLTSLVWAAKAQMLVEPQMYSEAAKEALKEELKLAEKALDGTYVFPYSRDREFLVPRDDEAIQYTTNYNVMMHNYGMSNYGLEPALTWYKNQNIAAASFVSMDLEPVYATFVHHYPANKKDVYGNNIPELLVGVAKTDRVALLQFDLSKIPGDVMSSQLTIANKNNGGSMFLNLEDDDWDGNAISAEEYEKKHGGAMNSKQQLVEFTIGSPTVLDVTDAVVGQVMADQKISFSISPSNVTYPVAIYGNHESVDPSLRPRLSVIVSSTDDTRLDERYNEVTKLVKTFLDGAKAGNSTGQYPEKYLAAVQKTYGTVTSIYDSGVRDVYQLGEEMVAVENAVRDARNHRILNLGDVQNLFLDQKDIESLKKNTDSVPELKEVKEKVVKTADMHDLKELQKLYKMVTGDDIAGLNEEGYKVWSDGRNINFTSPSGTKSAWIEVRLSKEDHEKVGCGHAWLDNIQLIPSKSENPKIPNAGFEEKDKGWTFIEGKNTTGKFASDYAYEGKGSLYIENTDEGAEGYWKSDTFPFGEDGYELRFAGKYDDKFKGRGLIFVVHYLDESGKEIGKSAELGRNTKSTLVFDTSYASGYQACALAYTLTGDEEYAKRSFWYMMLFLNDHLQGVEHWTVTGKRPDDFDYYGAVQEGRNANTLATAYSLIKSADIFGGDKDLEEDYYNKVRTLIRDLLDVRDRTEMTPEDAALNSNNWHTDMSIGAAMLAMAFYEQIPNAQQYIDNGKHIVEGQLAGSIRGDGSWPESIRYHISALNKMALFAKGLRHVTGEDWFGEGGTVTKMLEFIVQVQAPAYVNGNIGTPTIGDDTLNGGELFSVLGWYWDEVVENNPELGQQMYETWVKAGKPIGSFGSEDNILQNFFLNPDFEDEYEWNEAYELNLGTSDFAKEWGLYQFRNNYGTPNETYLAFVANEKALGHNHYDQLSFSMYYHSTPLVVDPGIESYFSSSKGIYVSTGSHATVQFANNNGFQNIGVESYDRSLTAGSLLDWVQASTNAADGTEGKLTRTIAYGKSGRELFAIWDRVEDATHNTRWNLPVSAKAVTVVDNNKVKVEGFDGIGMTLLLLGDHASVTIDQIRGAGKLPIKEGGSSPLVDIIRAEGKEPNSNYFAVMLPYAGEATEVSYETAAAENGLSAYWIYAGEECFLVAANATGEEQAVELGDVSCIQLSDGRQVTGRATIPNGELTILRVGSIDKTALEELTAQAEAIDLKKYEDAGQAEFKAALEAARAGLTNKNLTQEEINTLYQELKNRMDALKLRKTPSDTVDKTALRELTACARALDLTKYEEAEKAEFEAALKAAEAGLENSNLTQQEVDALYQELKIRMDALRLKGNSAADQVDKVDKSALKKLVDQAKALDFSQYQEVGKVEFREALKAAEAGLENSPLSQSEVDVLYNMLKKAMDGLKKLEQGPSYMSKDGSKAPRTGDNTDMVLYIMIMLMSVGVFLVILRVRYKK